MTSADIFYDVAIRRLDEQIDRNDAYGSKVTAAISVGTTVLPITYGLTQLQGQWQPIEQPAPLLLLLAGAAYILLMCVSFAVLVPATLDYRPSLSQLDAHSKVSSETVTKRWVARECVKSIGDNERILGRKGTLVTAALVLLALETVLLSVAALVVLW
jgi:hypothetical protein